MKKPVLVIMAAGMGSRYGGLKQIDPVDAKGRIIMDFSIFDAKRAGFEKVIFIIKKEQEDLFREAVGDRVSEYMEVSYAYQEINNIPAGFQVPEGRVKPWGTAHAVYSCKDMIDGPFAVINADDYYGREAFQLIYDYLNKNRYVNISLVITYSDTYQGARHTILGDGPKFRKKNTVKDCIHAIKDLAPDLIIVAGWSELIPNEILSIPRMGVIGFHPAKLPFDRGRSVLAWQIEDGYTETSLTMFKYSDYPDGGDILAQETIAIASNDYINDILDKVDAASLNLIRAYFPLLRKGFLKGVKQDLSVGSFRRLRSADDSIIKWDRNSVEIYNKIRAISHPYPGATTKFDDKTMLVWKSEIISSFPFPVDTKPGTIVAQCYDNTLIVKTRDAYLRLTEYEWK